MDNVRFCKKISLLTEDNIAWIYVTAVSFALYIYTLSPGITWGDSAKLVNYVINKRFTEDFVGGHNLHTILGIIFNVLPFHDVAYKQNLMSAFFAALTLGIFYLIARKILGLFVSALGATVALAVSQMFWMMAVINESYSIVYFFIALALFFSLVYRESKKNIYLLLISIIICLGAFDNALIIIMAPLYLVFFIMAFGISIFRVQKMVAVLGGLIIGVILTLGYLKIVMPDSHVFDAIYLSVTNGGSIYIKSFRHTILQLFHYPAYLFYQFPLWGILLGFIGIYESLKSDRILFITLVVGLVVDILFGTSYMTQRAFTLMVPSFMLFSLFIGYGINFVSKRSIILKNKAYSGGLLLILFFTPILFYNSVSEYLLKHPNLMLVHARTLPYRNNITYYLVPNKNNNFGPSEYAKGVFAILPRKAILIADFTPEEVLRYYQTAYGYGKDVNIVDEDHYVFMGTKGGVALVEYIKRQLNRGYMVFLADDNTSYYFTSELKKNFNIEKVGIIYKIALK